MLGRIANAFGTHDNWVWIVDFSSDGQTLVSCSKDETILLHKLTHLRSANMYTIADSLGKSRQDVPVTELLEEIVLDKITEDSQSLLVTELVTIGELKTRDYDLLFSLLLFAKILIFLVANQIFFACES
jgi:WD40 repeat protein